MEPTGLINKLIFNMEINWEAHLLLEQSKEKVAMGRTLGLTLKTLKEVGKSKDIHGDSFYCA